MNTALLVFFGLLLLGFALGATWHQFRSPADGWDDPDTLGDHAEGMHRHGEPFPQTPPSGLATPPAQTGERPASSHSLAPCGAPAPGTFDTSR